MNSICLNFVQSRLSESQKFDDPMASVSRSWNESYPVAMDDILRMNRELSSSLCRVDHLRTQGTGALVNLRRNNEPDIWTFMTCNHVVPTVDTAELCALELYFTNPKLGTLFIQPDWIRFAWTHSVQRLDVTVVEFTPNAFQYLQEKGAVFLNIEEPHEGNKVALFQFPKGTWSLAFNVIESFSEDNQIMYHIGADDGSSGSPVVKWSTAGTPASVVGVHRRRQGTPEGEHPKSNDPLGYKRFGSNIINIYEKFMQERSRYEF